MSGKKHAVAVAEEAVLLLDGMAIGGQNRSRPAKALTSMSRLDWGR
jgi:hypothetical protein